MGHFWVELFRIAPLAKLWTSYHRTSKSVLPLILNVSPAPFIHVSWKWVDFLPIYCVLYLLAYCIYSNARIKRGSFSVDIWGTVMSKNKHLLGYNFFWEGVVLHLGLSCIWVNVAALISTLGSDSPPLFLTFKEQRHNISNRCVSPNIPQKLSWYVAFRGCGMEMLLKTVGSHS